jgi:hypothetical protein
MTSLRKSIQNFFIQAKPRTTRRSSKLQVAFTPGGKWNWTPDRKRIDSFTS